MNVYSLQRYYHRVGFSSPVNCCYLQAWQINLYKFALTKTFRITWTSVLWKEDCFEMAVVQRAVTLVVIGCSFIVWPLHFIRNEARGALGHVECNLMNECWTLADPLKFTLAFLNMPLCIEWPHGHLFEPSAVCWTPFRAVSHPLFAVCTIFGLHGIDFKHTVLSYLMFSYSFFCYFFLFVQMQDTTGEYGQNEQSQYIKTTG